MVNDTTANALDTIPCRTIPEEDPIFPIQTYDWSLLTQKIRNNVELVLKEI